MNSFVLIASVVTSLTVITGIAMGLLMVITICLRGNDRRYQRGPGPVRLGGLDLQLSGDRDYRGAGGVSWRL